MASTNLRCLPLPMTIRLAIASTRLARAYAAAKLYNRAPGQIAGSSTARRLSTRVWSMSGTGSHAIAIESDVVLVDEPASALDPDRHREDRRPHAGA